MSEVIVTGLIAAAQIAEVENRLIAAAPLVEPRLQAIAQAGVVGLQNILLEHGRDNA